MAVRGRGLREATEDMYERLNGSTALELCAFFAFLPFFIILSFWSFLFFISYYFLFLIFLFLSLFFYRLVISFYSKKFMMDDRLA